MKPGTTTASEAYINTEAGTLAARFVNGTGRHVFLTGRAGTGKTSFLQRLSARTHKRHVVVAPTGIAALNAGGVTIHSQFLLPFGAFVPERQLPPGIELHGPFLDRDTLTRRHPLNAMRRQVLRTIDLLVIDEVSMLRADVLDAIDHRLRTVRRRWDEAFGGVQLLFIGDLHQLPPIVKDDEWNVLRQWYGSMHFFEARALKESGYAHIELDRIFRQQDDRFITILDHLRENTVTQADVDTLNAHYRPGVAETGTEGTIVLTTHNRTADEINQRALARLPGHAHRFEAEIEGDFPESMFPVQRELELKEGAQIMFIRNDPAKAFVNGQLARVERIAGGEVRVRLLDGGTPCTLERETWENKRYEVDPDTGELTERILGTFMQYPVKLAWAITVHKSQGLTFDRAIIDVGRAFAPGQVYVALSRLRSLDGLTLRTPIDPSVVTTDRDVAAFNERRHGQPPLPEQLREHQRHYLRGLLADAFGLDDILGSMQRTLQEHEEAAEFEDEGMRTALRRLHDRLLGEQAVARKFQAQLARLLDHDDRPLLLERIAKGADHFGALLKDTMRDLLMHLAQVELLSRTKQYGHALREVDNLLLKKLANIAKAAHVAACILEDREVTRDDAAEKRLAGERASLVEAAKAWVQEHAPTTRLRSGRRRKRREAAGEEAGEEGGPLEGRRNMARTTRRVKGETYGKTYALLKEGHTPEEAARLRGLSRGTIEGHIARGIAEGALEIEPFLPAHERDLIADWMREHPGEGLNAAQGWFEGRFTYGQLRMVQAWLKRGGE